MEEHLAALGQVKKKRESDPGSIEPDQFGFLMSQDTMYAGSTRQYVSLADAASNSMDAVNAPVSFRHLFLGGSESDAA